MNEEQNNTVDCNAELEMANEITKDELDVLDADTTSNNDIKAEHKVNEKEAGQRLDKLAATVFAGFSRAQLQSWITEGNLTVNESTQKPKYRVKAEDELKLTAKLEQHGQDLPEDIPLDIVYEDDDVVVINKPVGMVVHPGAGNWTGTLVNGLLYHYPEQSHLPRAGLVHRIDKDTSGLLIVAKTKVAQLDLMEQLKDKSVYRHYQCVVAGSSADLQCHRLIDLPIARHRTQRTKMSVIDGGKDAITHILKITPLCDNYSLLSLALETGRTHQIRVHLSYLGYPLVGDPVYGVRQQLRAGLTDEQRNAIRDFNRQALHAFELGFVHPSSQEDILVKAEMPDDMLALIEVLQD